MAKIEVYRVTIPNPVSSFTIPSLTRPGIPKKFYIRNKDSLNSLRITFKENEQNNYIQIAPGEQTPVLGGLRGGEKIYTDGVGGDVTTEFVIWEE